LNQNTPILRVPDRTARVSFTAALREYHAEGRHLELDDTELITPRAFADYIARLRSEAQPATFAGTGLVPSTILWWMRGDVYLGRLSIRHELTKELRRKGGHIGFEVRPSARGSGHATAMLRAALPIARQIGIVVALITCDSDNARSRSAIESNGGVLSEEEGNIVRYLVDTSGRADLGARPTPLVGEAT
jgi:predicted acetyltransferase